jgi:hypothetical protein
MKKLLTIKCKNNYKIDPLINSIFIPILINPILIRNHPQSNNHHFLYKNLSSKKLSPNMKINIQIVALSIVKIFILKCLKLYFISLDNIQDNKI